MSKKQSEMPSNVNDTPLKQLSDFSLMSGGPLYQLLRRTRLCGDGMELVHRRVFVVVLLLWLPLLLLSIVDGRAWGSGVKLTFLHDIETHLRLLIAAPLLIVAEVRAHRVLSNIVRIFVDRDLVPNAARPQFDAAIRSALRLRNSIVVELLLIAFVYSVGVPLVWSEIGALNLNSWYANSTDGHLQPSTAGRWFAYVSMPVFQFLALRWFFRLIIWARFLWQVARIKLNLEPTHPDGTAGLHFLARSGRAFQPVLLALGTVIAGVLANRIFYDGAKLLQFQVEIVGVAGLLTLLVLGPLLVFMSQLREIRFQGMDEYGGLGQQYARGFNRKWIRGDRPADEAPLGSPDIQSLADLRNGYTVIEGIRLTPFGMKNVTSLAASVLLPVAPLLLTTFSVEQLLATILKALF